MTSRLRFRLLRRHLAVIAVLFAIVAAAGQRAVAEAPVDGPANKPINKMCPVMPLEEVDPAITTEYRGKTIAFCCDNCLKKFRVNPERYADRMAAFANDGEDQADGHGSDKPDSDGGASEGAHNHNPDSGSDETKAPLLGRMHPVVVHFPLAGVPIATAAMFGWLVSRKKLFAYGDVPPLVLAAAFSIVCVVTGNVAHDSMRFSKSLHEYVEWHQFTATALMILVLVLTSLRIWRWRRLEGNWLVAYACGLVVASSLVGVVGYLGGSLVFGPDHLLP